ncbi:hypothetical protein [Anaerotruncus massiliensis (ex Togo et al. 2019)]|uniref:hypothetical protein n=1 Tax=Anaerotruncus TaxID=244127 RepID=UPI000C764886|nr:hypothetical protein [Anaerotruncus massiliensis (ex Togo et al. 2019)]
MSEREKLAVRLDPELRERLDRCYTMDGSRSRREYIENAIQFYTDYLEMSGGSSLLPKEVTSAINGRLGLFEDRLSSLLFKMTVALDMNAGILSDAYEFSEESLRQRRAESVKNVKQTNGLLSLEQRARDSGEM